jgi:hypothetical protein
MMRKLSCARSVALLAFTIGPLSSCRKTSESSSDAHLVFFKDGSRSADLSFETLSKQMTPETVETFDPYYAKKKHFRAFPLRRVLALGFSGELELDKREFIFRAKDGYAAYFRGACHGGWGLRSV